MSSFYEISNEEKDELLSIDEFNLLGYQYTIMYMSRVHALGEFIFLKVLQFKDTIFSSHEVNEVVEAFTIKAVCDWEWYVERMLYQCLKDDTSKLSEHLDLKLPTMISEDECAAYMNGLDYFDLRSIERLHSLANQVLTDCKNPFKLIKEEAKVHINDLYKIRNYVAHRSNASKRELIRVYKRYNQLEFIEPGSFLLSPSKSPGRTTRFQDFNAAYWLASFKILEFLYPRIFKWIVKDEKIYNAACHSRFRYLRSLSDGLQDAVVQNRKTE